MRRTMQDVTVHPGEGWIKFRFIDGGDVEHIDLKDNAQTIWEPVGDMLQVLFLFVRDQKRRIDALESKIEGLEHNAHKLHHRLRLQEGRGAC